MDAPWDCLIVGGGPAGLAAATYLSEFRRSTLVIDAGESRAALIPTSHNYPAFADGISGPALLDRLRAQASQYGTVLRAASVERLERQGREFIATVDHGGEVQAQTVIVATGYRRRKAKSAGHAAVHLSRSRSILSHLRRL